jgi:hypothetical protein
MTYACGVDLPAAGVWHRAMCPSRTPSVNAGQRRLFDGGGGHEILHSSRPVLQRRNSVAAQESNCFFQNTNLRLGAMSRIAANLVRAGLVADKTSS